MILCLGVASYIAVHYLDFVLKHLDEGLDEDDISTVCSLHATLANSNISKIISQTFISKVFNMFYLNQNACDLF